MKKLLLLIAIVSMVFLLSGCLGTYTTLNNYTFEKSEVAVNWKGIDFGYFKSPKGETFKFYLPEYIGGMMTVGQNYNITYIMNGYSLPNDYRITSFKPTNLK
jgi:hypothetical protein